MKICPKCGRQYPDNSIMCPRCKIHFTGAMYQQPAYQPQQQFQNQPMTQQQMQLAMQAQQIQLQQQALQLQAQQMASQARCPRCGSTSLSGNKKGFGIGKAVVGNALLGPIGLVAGNIGAKKVHVTCLSCGYRFKK